MGTSVSVFRANQSDGVADVYGIELPGKGRQISKTPIENISCAIERVLSLIAPLLNAPVGFLGHSMGALIAFELAHAVVSLGTKPACLVAVACGRPNRVPPGFLPPLSDAAIQRRLRLIGGPAAEVLESAQLSELLLPGLRADFRIADEYCADEHREPLACPVIAIGGRDDPLCSPEDLSDWERETTGAFEQIMFLGGHFFLRDACSGFWTAIQDRVTKLPYLRGTSI